VIAALVLASVFFALVWPEERATGRGRARAVLFSLLAGAVGFAMTGRQADRSTRDSAGRAFQPYTEGLTNARLAESQSWSAHWLKARGGNPDRPLPPSKRHDGPNARRPARSTLRAGSGRRSGGPDRPPERSPADPNARLRERALRSYAQAIRFAPESTLFRRQYAILLADAGRREEALSQFREVARIQASRRQVSDEGRLWERLYGPRPPSRAELPALEARLRRLHLGWFADLVRRSVYRRLGLRRQAEEASDRAGREAFLLISALAVLWLAMMGLAVIGLGLLIAALIRWRRGRLRPLPAEFHASAAPLLEAFILYLFLMFSPALLRFSGRLSRASASERADWLTIVLLLGPDLLSLVALGYLLARLRPCGLSLAEIGLRTRAWGQDLLAGFGGYAAVLPVVYGSALLATWLGRRYFPQLPPPTHPIQLLTLSGSPSVRFAIMIAAVVGAPFLEETFFRGMLYGALRRRFGVAVGVLASAAVFAGLHPQLPLGFLPIFVLGAAMALLYEWRQSLVPGMFLHALNNGAIWVLLNLLLPPG
jgi:membrane protease YdiL (CAAX protease family)